MKRITMLPSLLLTASAFAALPDGGPYTETVDGIEWSFMVNDGEASLGSFGYSSSAQTAIPEKTSGAIIVPSALGGCPVTRIGTSAFVFCRKITIVTIPPSVTHIGDRAFQDCDTLKTAKIPSSVTSIGGEGFLSGVFADCGVLTKIVVDEENQNYKSEDGLLLTKDGRTLLEGVNGTITIPSGVTSIADSAFYGRTGLKSVTIPSSVTNIGAGAFAFCRYALTSIVIPASVTSIGYSPFSGCGALTAINVDTGNPNYKSENGLLLTKDGRTLLGGVNGTVTIPSGVTSIADSAFYGRTGLKSVTIPSSVTSIGIYAFAFCEGLNRIIVDETNPNYKSANGLLLSKDGRTLLAGINGDVTIPVGVTRIEEEAFSGRKGLKSLTLPSSVTSVGNYAFEDCDGLTTIYVEKGDTARVKTMAEESGHDTSGVKFIEGTGLTPNPDSETESGFEKAHSFNGLATDEFGMCGMIQVATTKKTKKGDVKVSGFVMLEDGKKQTLKSATGTVSGSAVSVTTKVGKLGELALTITDDGFTGTLGDMTVASSEVGEETGIISGTLKMSYFDAKTSKIKTKSIIVKGLTDGSTAEGTATVKGKSSKLFKAEISD